MPHPKTKMMTVTLVILSVFLILASAKKTIEIKHDLQASGFAPGITITAEGKVPALITTAEFTVGILTQTTTVKAGLEKVNKSIQDVNVYLEAGGVAAEDRRVQNYFINPSYDYSSQPAAITGYEIRREIALKLRDLSQLDTLLSKSAEKGMNQMGTITFSSEEKEAQYQEALAKALENARAKAEGAAAKLGKKLGKITSVNELPSYPAYDSYTGMPRQYEVGAQVTVTYELR